MPASRRLALELDAAHDPASLEHGAREDHGVVAAREPVVASVPARAIRLRLERFVSSVSSYRDRRLDRSAAPIMHSTEGHLAGPHRPAHRLAAQHPATKENVVMAGFIVARFIGVLAITAVAYATE